MRYKYLNRQEFGAQTRLLRQVDDAILAPSNAMISAHLGLVLQEDIEFSVDIPKTGSARTGKEAILSSF